ncbi:MAG: NADH-quinone oxidoreductase subunit C [Candidatus Omnitrophota bacterium]|jgi:Ni,Fe-hydrogenase III large subunit/Ni,Fe-hydrogenase III component G
MMGFRDELYIDVKPEEFRSKCLELHKKLSSPVMMYFAVDERKEKGSFAVYCAFLDAADKRWAFVRMYLPQDGPAFESVSKDIFSASLFEREIREMFGIEPRGNPDLRRLNLHEEVWPEGFYPLRKDFTPPERARKAEGSYKFRKVEGEGIFEVPVGPVHAGIIGPGHFRFSAAGEPIINLEARLGFTHRGVEKIFEGMPSAGSAEAVCFSERVSGDSAFAYSTAYCSAVEKIYGIRVPERAQYIRAIFLELERMYNHANDIGGMALDVGFSFPNAFASVVKEKILALNEKMSGSRYLKGVNTVGGVNRDLSGSERMALADSLAGISKDLEELKAMLKSSISFMDRVDKTGILKKKTAADLGIVGLAARASGIPMDLRNTFPGVYAAANFNLIKEEEGDVLARLNLRLREASESARLIKEFVRIMNQGDTSPAKKIEPAAGCGIGHAEGWRGPVLFWIKTGASGRIERCKIVDPSFHNWQGLCFAVLGNIIPDFPLCNKSFDLSYPGNDL